MHRKQYAHFNDRDIIVINGQPFYKSTGINTEGGKGTWIPFIMARGRRENLWRSFKNLSDKFNPEMIKGFCANILSSFGDNHIYTLIKYSRDTAAKADTFPDEENYTEINPDTKLFRLEYRMPTKETRITSCQLTGFEKFYLKHTLQNPIYTDEQIHLAKERIHLEDKPCITIDNPDLLNLWLNEQGATYIGIVLGLKTIASASEEKKTISTSISSASSPLLQTPSSTYEHESKSTTIVVKKSGLQSFCLFRYCFCCCCAICSSSKYDASESSLSIAPANQTMY